MAPSISPPVNMPPNTLANTPVNTPSATGVPQSAGAQRATITTVAPTTEIVVCTTCRPAGVPRDQPAPGHLLYDAVQAALGSGEPVPDGAERGAQTSTAGSTSRLKLRGLACMSGCDRACTVALQAPGKFSYYFGDLSADAETAVQLIACAQLHRDSADGSLLRNARPERLRSGILARLPAVEPLDP